MNALAFVGTYVERCVSGLRHLFRWRHPKTLCTRSCLPLLRRRNWDLMKL